MNKLPTEKAIENIYEFIQFIDEKDVDTVERNFIDNEVDFKIKDALDSKKSLEVKTYDKGIAQIILNKLLKPIIYKEK